MLANSWTGNSRGKKIIMLTCSQLLRGGIRQAGTAPGNLSMGRMLEQEFHSWVMICMTEVSVPYYFELPLLERINPMNRGCVLIVKAGILIANSIRVWIRVRIWDQMYAMYTRSSTKSLRDRTKVSRTGGTNFRQKNFRGGAPYFFGRLTQIVNALSWQPGFCIRPRRGFFPWWWVRGRQGAPPSAKCHR